MSLLDYFKKDADTFALTTLSANNPFLASLVIATLITFLIALASGGLLLATTYSRERDGAIGLGFEWMICLAIGLVCAPFVIFVCLFLVTASIVAVGFPRSPSLWIPLCVSIMCLSPVSAGPAAMLLLAFCNRYLKSNGILCSTKTLDWLVKLALLELLPGVLLMLVLIRIWIGSYTI